MRGMFLLNWYRKHAEDEEERADDENVTRIGKKIVKSF